MPIDFNQLREFIEAIAKTDISELAIKEGDFELTLQKANPQNDQVSYTAGNIAPATPATITNTLPTPQPINVSVETSPTMTGSVEEKPSPAPKADNLLEITSPMVGTFYSASAPGEASFVDLGDNVSNGQVVCIIEAMKLMNEIEAEVSGKVVEIAVENGEPVEYGQTLMWVSPN